MKERREVIIMMKQKEEGKTAYNLKGYITPDNSLEVNNHVMSKLLISILYPNRKKL